MKLRKELRLLDVFCIASGAMISSGIFVLPGIAFARTGPSVFVSYLLAAALAYTGMVSTIELTTAMPKAGGNYFFTTRSLGPGIGTIAGLLSWFSLGLKSAFALIGMSAFTVLLFPFDITLVAIGLCLFFVALNLFGVKEAGRFQVFLVLIMLGLMAIYIVRGVGAFDINRMTPFRFEGTQGILSTAGFVFVSYGGLLHIASVAEEIQDPKKNIPLGMILSLVIVGIAYTFIVAITVGVMDPAVLAESLTPITDGAEAFLGGWGRTALSLAAIFAFISTANAGLLSSSRYLFALGRDQLLPEFFTSVNHRFHTPHWAVLVTGLFMILVLLLPLDTLVQSASTVLMLTYILSNLSVIILRESKIGNYRPSFRAPLYPWLQIIGSIGFVVLIFEMGLQSLLITLGLITVGFLVFLFYGKSRANSEFALMHLIQRVFDNKAFLVGRETSNNELEAELRHIIHDRDDVVEDEFDRLVHDAVVLDIEESVSMNEFFRLVASNAPDELGLSDSEIFSYMVEREKLSSTVLSHFVAVPHIVVPGQNHFALMFARSREGIRFETTDGEEPIHAAFVLFGTRDRRSLHLHALASVAQIVQNEEFERRWIEAAGQQQLRDVLLVSERRRHRMPEQETP